MITKFSFVKFQEHSFYAFMVGSTFNNPFHKQIKNFDFLQVFPLEEKI